MGNFAVETIIKKPTIMKNRIKEQLQIMGRTQREVAAKMGISHISLSHIVNSPNMPKMDTFQRIAEILGIPAWKLFLTDDELEDIREGQFSNSFNCPVCGARLTAIVATAPGQS